MVRRWTIGGVLTCAFVVGCGSPRTPVAPLPVSDMPSPPTRRASGSRIVAPLSESLVTAGPSARSVKGRPIRSWVYGVGGPTVMFLGGIHGDEPAGASLCQALREYLAAHPEVLTGCRVVVAPTLNPDGLAAGRRTNARGVDLNRNFDTTNRKASRPYGMRPLSEPESRFVAELITRFRPETLVTVHQPLACVDYDGPGATLARAMSRACGLGVKKLGASPGSLGSYVGEDLGIPTVTLELPAAATRQDRQALWKTYGAAMLKAVRLTGVD